jgi:hypothetical protein
VTRFEPALLAVFLAIPLVGCDLGKRSGSASDAGDAGVTPENACLEYAQILASAGQRCGQDYQVTYDDFIRTIALGDCANVVAIRDFRGLWNTCLVVLQTESCADISAGVFDKTCQNQLVLK